MQAIHLLAIVLDVAIIWFKVSIKEYLIQSKNPSIIQFPNSQTIFCQSHPKFCVPSQFPISSRNPLSWGFPSLNTNVHLQYIIFHDRTWTWSYHGLNVWVATFKESHLHPTKITKSHLHSPKGTSTKKVYDFCFFDYLKRISQKNPLFSVGGFPWRISLWVPRSKGEEALKILAEGAEQQVAGSPGIPSETQQWFFMTQTRFPKPGCLVHWKFSSIPQVVSCIIDYWLICITLLHKSLLQAEKHSPEGKQ